MGDIERISPADASVRLSNGWAYVDVRTVEEFEAGHPAGSQNVPWLLQNGSNPDFIRAMEAVFARDAKIVLGCKSGVRSLTATRALVAAGFTNVVDQRAGWDGSRSPFGQVLEKGWLQLALPREEGAPAGRSWSNLHSRATQAARRAE
jgi:rhodanese-related sulfurtransferase